MNRFIFFSKLLLFLFLLNSFVFADHNIVNNLKNNILDNKNIIYNYNYFKSLNTKKNALRTAILSTPIVFGGFVTIQYFLDYSKTYNKNINIFPNNNLNSSVRSDNINPKQQNQSFCSFVIDLLKYGYDVSFTMGKSIAYDIVRFKLISLFNDLFLKTNIHKFILNDINLNDIVKNNSLIVSSLNNIFFSAISSDSFVDIKINRDLLKHDIEKILGYLLYFYNNSDLNDSLKKYLFSIIKNISLNSCNLLNNLDKVDKENIPNIVYSYTKNIASLFNQISNIEKLCNISILENPLLEILNNMNNYFELLNS